LGRNDLGTEKTMREWIQAVRGMHDILPQHTAVWQRMELEVAHVLASYGYQEIRLPLIEKTELFRRSIGEDTDIVEKEMYTFEDRNGESLTLRPEGTAGCVRAALENGLLHKQVQRLWYGGPMFRHERPQKGRYRQFHQIGVEAFGMLGPDVDAELILMTARLWRALGLMDRCELQVNSLGTTEERRTYRRELVAYLSDHRDLLDADSHRRLESNPLRVLDSKSPPMQPVIASAPKLIDRLGKESRAHFDELLALLGASGVAYTVNPHLVRGLDYYSRTVFEWVSGELGAQGTVCAGGRYDGLVEQLGGGPTPAVGFALGLERLASLLEESSAKGQDASVPEIFVATFGHGARREGIILAEQLRDRSPGLRILVHCGKGGVKSQFRRADRSGARIALILGEDEVREGRVSVKSLRGSEEQRTVERAELEGLLGRLLVGPRGPEAGGGQPRGEDA
jgi:histidyl-tRNA synthetase